eukprot:SAG31_NODE_1918_length_6921_cov_2.015245_6_plen_126_part_00
MRALKERAVYRQGDIAKEMFIVLSGRLPVTVHRQHAQEKHNYEMMHVVSKGNRRRACSPAACCKKRGVGWVDWKNGTPFKPFAGGFDKTELSPSYQKKPQLFFMQPGQDLIITEQVICFLTFDML